MAEKTKGVQVSAVFSEEELDALNEIRWELRLEKRSDVIKYAVQRLIADDTEAE